MKVAVYSTKSYDKKFFDSVNRSYHLDLTYFDFALNKHSAKMAEGFDAVCIFVNDECGKDVVEQLAKHGVKTIALRCAGFNNVDLATAEAHNIQVVRVPAYSPEAVAEYTLGMMLTLNRQIHRAYQRTRDGNFALDGLLGYNFHGRTAGVIGTGKIGVATIKLLLGFGMKVICVDPHPKKAIEDLGVTFVSLPELFAQSDVISLHCPATSDNYHLLNKAAFEQMKDGVMIINTSRGTLIDTNAALNAINSGKIGALGLDVYEKERNLFYQDKSNDLIVDNTFHRLGSYHNVLITGHQAFFTSEALTNICEVTLENLNAINKGLPCENFVKAA